MKQLTLISSVLSLFLIVTVATQAQPCENGYYGKKGVNASEDTRGYRQERLKELLNLTDEQFQQIEAQMLAHQKKILPLENELNEKEAKMRTLETADNADLKAINSLIDEMGMVKTKIAKERAAHHQEIRKILTPEQRIRFDTHAQNRKMGRENRGKN